MSNKTGSSYKQYWDENISKWGDLYLDISHGHESLTGNRVITWFYNRLIVPHEAKLMKMRYRKTIEFLEAHAESNKVLNDLGCGTGIFTVEAISRGLKVNAIDLSEQSLKITAANVKQHHPKLVGDVTYLQADAQSSSLPKSDLCLCVGVLPYVQNVEAFLSNLLASTNTAFLQITDKNNFSNWIRRVFPFLNVRRLHFQTEKEISDIATKNGFTVKRIEDFATGKLITLGKA